MRGGGRKGLLIVIQVRRDDGAIHEQHAVAATV